MSIHVNFIRRLGGVKKVAEICGVTKGAVSQWKKRRIPLAQMNFLKTKFPNEFNEIQEKESKYEE
ncbi:Cro/CI family transcriptional regulator [Conchiformibius steedae]|uniref:Helix-turn-helix domain-containing protein n=1 Tax=Conchiformibius steedae TaxID=153493 RepID=A0A3P2A9W4_9NEIS|nr:Cro/CI family transcriptional regulator [Conchiformibius steedae]RRD90413.1 hypothetical protein EII21_05710 [Conchiformibius steedae]